MRLIIPFPCIPVSVHHKGGLGQPGLPGIPGLPGDKGAMGAPGLLSSNAQIIHSVTLQQTSATSDADTSVFLPKDPQVTPQQLLHIF